MKSGTSLRRGGFFSDINIYIFLAFAVIVCVFGVFFGLKIYYADMHEGILFTAYDSAALSSRLFYIDIFIMSMFLISFFGGIFSFLNYIFLLAFSFLNTYALCIFSASFDISAYQIFLSALLVVLCVLFLCCITAKACLFSFSMISSYTFGFNRRDARFSLYILFVLILFLVFSSMIYVVSEFIL